MKLETSPKQKIKRQKKKGNDEDNIRKTENPSRRCNTYIIGDLRTEKRENSGEKIIKEINSKLFPIPKKP